MFLEDIVNNYSFLHDPLCNIRYKMKSKEECQNTSIASTLISGGYAD